MAFGSERVEVLDFSGFVLSSFLSSVDKENRFRCFE